MKILKAMCAAAVALSLVGCAQTSSSDEDLTKVTLMLDYTPNTNHTGFYVAKNKGYYKEAGLDVDIIEPGDNATTSTSEDPLPIKTIATIIQHNTSGFVSLKSANINSVKDFEGKTYAGWGAPSEEAVIKAVMNEAGADFNKLTIVGSDGSGIAGLSDEVGKNKVNLGWEFYGWAIIKAMQDGYDVNYMPLADLDSRLDYYTPVIITNNKMIKKNSDTVKKFMEATKKGYEYAIDHPNKAAEILHEDALKDTDMKFLKESQKYLSSQYAKDADSWGVMKDSVWNNYTDFMYETGLINKKIDAKDQYTNEFVK